MLQEHSALLYHTMLLEWMEFRWKSRSLEVAMSSTPWKRLLGNIHGHVSKSRAIAKYNAEEVQAHYLKFLHHCEQWDLFRGNCLGLYVDFSGYGSHSDLCHVALVLYVTSAVLYPNSVPPQSHTRPHLVAINASLNSNGYTIWWRGDKSLLLIPQCAISEGQGTVHFPQAAKKIKK